MIQNKLSKKEILIFESVNKLIEDGVSLSNIKVSDISKTAQIGKGTIYEYFSSKEEVISKSLMYNMEQEINIILEKTLKVESFEEKIYALLDGIIQLSNKKCEYIQTILTNKDFANIIKNLSEDKNSIINFRETLVSVLIPIIDVGIKEGVINPTLSYDYIKLVFISALSGISNVINFSVEKSLDEEYKTNVKTFTYEMIKKSLS